MVDEKISHSEIKLSQGLINISKQFSEKLKIIEPKLADTPVAWIRRLHRPSLLA